MLDSILNWVVVVGPTIIGILVAFVPVGPDHPAALSRKWRRIFLAACVCLSVLTYWQQRRADEAHDREVQTQTQGLRDVAIAISKSNTALQAELASMLPNSSLAAKEIAGKVARILSARRIPASVAARLVRALRKSPKPSSITVLTASGDAEEFQYAVQLLDILRDAGWTAFGPDPGRTLCPPETRCRPLTGLAVQIPNANPVPHGTNELFGALRSAGIPVIVIKAQPRGPVFDSSIYLAVGSKPSP